MEVLEPSAVESASGNLYESVRGVRVTHEISIIYLIKETFGIWRPRKTRKLSAFNLIRETPGIILLGQRSVRGPNVQCRFVTSLQGACQHEESKIKNERHTESDRPYARSFPDFEISKYVKATVPSSLRTLGFINNCQRQESVMN